MFRWLLILSLCLPSTVGLLGGPQEGDAPRSRGLLSGLLCNEIASNNFLGTSCGCDIQPVAGKVGLNCQRNEKMCSIPGGRICGIPTWSGSFTLVTGGAITSKICYTNITYNDLPIPSANDDLCFDYSFNILNILCPGGILSCITGGGGLEEESDEGTMVESASVTFGDKPCSAKLCDKGIGIAFDCSKHLRGLSSKKKCYTPEILTNYLKGEKKLTGTFGNVLGEG
jgi:hypothetical protein